MKRLYSHRTLFALLAALVLQSSLFVQAAAERGHPNIIFFFIDDFGFGDLGIYGNDEVSTPAFDRLAKEGIRFTEAYVAAPICSPSRVAATTGQYPQRWRITSFLSNRRMNEERGMADFLDPRAPSLPRILQQNGYWTAQVGKWHMGGQRDVDDAPWIWEYGFDESITNFEGMGDRVFNVFEEWNGGGRAMGLDRVSSRSTRGSQYWVKRHAVTEFFVDRTLEILSGVKAGGQPLYINVWPMDTHIPLEPPPERRGDRTEDTLYHGVIEEMDLQFQRILEFVENDPHLRENTIIIVSSDNGSLVSGLGSTGGLRGGKGIIYEGGIRVPLIVWAPGLIPAERTGSVNRKTIFSMMDLPASILGMLGIQPPDDVRFDGEDLKAALFGDPVVRNEPLFWTHPTGVEISGPDFAVRHKDWKLVADEGFANVELYHLRDDPAESRNLVDEFPDITRKLLAELSEWIRSVEETAVELPLENRASRGAKLVPHVDMLFGDNFDRENADDVEVAGSGVFGSVGMVLPRERVYRVIRGEAASSLANRFLRLSDRNRRSELLVNHNFVDAEVLRAGGFKVGVDIACIETVATHLPERFAGFGVGLPADPQTIRELREHPGEADCFVELDMDRNVKVWIHGALVTQVRVNQAFGNLEARFSLREGFNVGEQVDLQVYFNGQLLDMRPERGDIQHLTFAWSRDQKNYIGLSAHAGDRVMLDNFSVLKGR